MTALPPVSFVVPVFNGAATLGEAVSSILDDNLYQDDEVVIVDDGSQDNSAEVALTLAANDSRIRVVKHRHNKGSANAARNTGIDNAVNDLLFNLDADNVLLPGSVKLLRTTRAGTGADAVAFGEIEYFDTSSGNKTHSWTMRDEITFMGNINAMTESPGGSGNFLYTREAWKRAGRCTEVVGAAWDSWAFAVDLLGTGSRIVCVPGTRYRHRTGYDSSFVRDQHKRNVSLLLLQVLLPYLHLIHPEDADYITSRAGRLIWVDELGRRPLRSASGEDAVPPAATTPLSQRELPVGVILKMLSNKVKRRLPFGR